MADKRPYSKIDVGYLSNPKIAALLDDYPRAVILHLACINYGVQHCTDGVVPLRIALRIACGTQCDAEILTQCGLLSDLGDGNVLVRDFLEHQRSAAEVKQRSQAASLAASAKWDAERNANRNAERTAERNAEKEREKEHTDASATRFAEFWAAYPKRVAKGAAERAWIKAAKKEQTDTLIAAALGYAAQSKGTEPKFIKNPATWLNQDCWLDETPASPIRPSGYRIEEDWSA